MASALVRSVAIHGPAHAQLGVARLSGPCIIRHEVALVSICAT